MPRFVYGFTTAPSQIFQINAADYFEAVDTPNSGDNVNTADRTTTTPPDKDPTQAKLHANRLRSNRRILRMFETSQSVQDVLAKAAMDWRSSIVLTETKGTFYLWYPTIDLFWQAYPDEVKAITVFRYIILIA